jgi:hypothetical protein
MLCSPAGLQAVSDGRNAAGVANGTLVAGGALAVAGVVLLVLTFVPSTERSRPSGSPSARRFVVGPPDLARGGAF